MIKYVLIVNPPYITRLTLPMNACSNSSQMSHTTSKSELASVTTHPPALQIQIHSKRKKKKNRRDNKITPCSLFVLAGLTYKPWLKVLLAGLTWEKNTVQAMNYKPDTSNPAETNRLLGGEQVVSGVFDNLHLAGWPSHGQPESDPNGTSVCVWLLVPTEPNSSENVFICLYKRIRWP